MTGNLPLSLAEYSGAKKLDLYPAFPKCPKTIDYDREKNKFDQLP